MKTFDDADQAKLLHPTPCPNYVQASVGNIPGQYDQELPLLFVYADRPKLTIESHFPVASYSAN